jgi:glycosyltransferase involved in cell wall biosynthesis
MNIVMLNDFGYTNGGASQSALTSALELARHHCKVTFFCAVGPAAVELTASGIDVVVLGQKEILKDRNRLRVVGRGIWNIRAAKELGAALDLLNPTDTVVHLHSWTKALTASVVRTALDRDFPVVFTMHDYFTVCPNGGFFNYPARGICHLKPLSAACVQSRCDQRSHFHKLWRVARQTVTQLRGHIPDGIRGFLAPSDLCMDVLRPFLPAAAMLRKLPNPHDVPRLDPADPGASESFVAVGRLAREKGMDLFARAAASLKVSARIVGDGDCRDEVQKLAPQAQITGWLPHADVIAEIRASRALVFPSLCYETQGMTVWEAASQGIPAIVPDTCAAREGIIDGVTGYWFRGGDWRDLAAKIDVLARDPKCAQKMGRAAYDQYWRNPMTPQRHASELMSFYRDILAGPARLNSTS